MLIELIIIIGYNTIIHVRSFLYSPLLYFGMAYQYFPRGWNGGTYFTIEVSLDRSHTQI